MANNVQQLTINLSFQTSKMIGNQTTKQMNRPTMKRRDVREIAYYSSLAKWHFSIHHDDNFGQYRYIPFADCGCYQTSSDCLPAFQNNIYLCLVLGATQNPFSCWLTFGAMMILVTIFTIPENREIRNELFFMEELLLGIPFLVYQPWLLVEVCYSRKVLGKRYSLVEWGSFFDESGLTGWRQYDTVLSKISAMDSYQCHCLAQIHTEFFIHSLSYLCFSMISPCTMKFFKVFQMYSWSEC